MAYPPNLRPRGFTLSIPLVMRLGKLLFERYGADVPATWRRLLVLLWMNRLEFSYTRIELGLMGNPLAMTRLWSWSLTLTTTLFSLSFGWRYENPFEYNIPKTSLTLRWKPAHWWNIPEGGLMFEREWTKTWEAWREEEWVITTTSMGVKKVCWLEEVEKRGENPNET